MKKLLILACLALFVASCQESLEERAERECKEFTQRMCPTPVVNNTRTDSVTFDKATKTYTYHCSFLNELDDSAAINRVRGQLHDALKKGVMEDTHTKAYKEAGFKFRYLCSSAKNPKTVLFDDTFTGKAE
ncbi:MAG: hypothetical protein J5506_02710 [Prevotella sp.]|nr:hypothetical protein [Prevotella sp.]